MKTSGIYYIKNLTNGKWYIGLSTNIEQRFTFHTKRLMSNQHKNKHLQCAFNKCGLDSFEFGLLEECDASVLPDREKFWISRFKSHDRDFGYNKTYGGEFGRVSADVLERRVAKQRLQVIPQDVRDKISKTLTGVVQPRDVVDRRAISIRKYDDDIESQVYYLRTQNGLTMGEIAKQLNIKNTSVRSILKRKGVSS